MKAAVFLPAGLGDALLHIPMIKELKKKGYNVTGIFSSPGTAQLFEESFLFEKILIVHSPIQFLLKSFLNFHKFEKTFLNVFAATRQNFLLAFIISKKIFTNKKADKLPRIIKRRISFISPQTDVHDSVQNLLLAFEGSWTRKLEEADFYLETPNCSHPNNLAKTYAAVQISAGNNINKFKNWPVRHWIAFFRELTKRYPQFNWVLLGEPREMEISEEIMKENFSNVISLVGKTRVRETIPIIKKSEFFLGLDGGLMHLAVSLGKSTITLWGPSDFKLYGYEHINPGKHKVIFRDIFCRPCNSWINPNRVRVDDPRACPDSACMQFLDPQKVIDGAASLIAKHISNA